MMIEECKHIECTNKKNSSGYCDFHYNGGIFGSGETYDQYEVIEEDFIKFIKIIPLNDNRNMQVCSPVLRDLIIRTCVQIEIFFKEWAKYECSENSELPLWNTYNTLDKRTNKPKGARNWTFKDYFHFNDYVNKRKLFVRELNESINGFQNWQKDSPPNWWKVYNSIKHSGIESKVESNLENALYSLSALFQLHCCNKYSRKYLEQFNSITAKRKTLGRIRIESDRIKTPIDSKKYLFMDIYGSQTHYEIEVSQETHNRMIGKGFDI